MQKDKNIVKKTLKNEIEELHKAFSMTIDEVEKSLKKASKINVGNILHLIENVFKFFNNTLKKEK